jgi:hypothetical protein
VKVRPCAFAGANSIFAGDKLLTTPNPDVNDDMEMFEMLGLTPQNHLQKFLSLLQLKLRALNLPLLRKPKWSRPDIQLTGILKPQLKKSNFHTYKKLIRLTRLNGFLCNDISKPNKSPFRN